MKFPLVLVAPAHAVQNLRPAFTPALVSILMVAAMGWSEAAQPESSSDTAKAETPVVAPAITPAATPQPQTDTSVTPIAPLPTAQPSPVSESAPALAPSVAEPAVAPTPKVAPSPSPGEKLKEAYSLHPLTSIMVMGFSLSYERFLKPGVSLDIPVFLGLADKLYDQGRLYLGSGLGVRFYLTENQSGGYLSPTFQFLNATYFEDKTEFERKPGGNVLSVMGGVRYGYKFLWEHFTIDLGLGFYGLRSFGGDLTTIEPEDTSLLFPMSHFALGIPF